MRLPLVHKDVDSAIWKEEELRKSTKFRYLYYVVWRVLPTALPRPGASLQLV